MREQTGKYKIDQGDISKRSKDDIFKLITARYFKTALPFSWRKRNEKTSESTAYFLFLYAINHKRIPITIVFNSATAHNHDEGGDETDADVEVSGRNYG